MTRKGSSYGTSTTDLLLAYEAYEDDLDSDHTMSEAELSSWLAEVNQTAASQLEECVDRLAQSSSG